MIWWRAAILACALIAPPAAAEQVLRYAFRAGLRLFAQAALRSEEQVAELLSPGQARRRHGRGAQAGACRRQVRLRPGGRGLARDRPLYVPHRAHRADPEPGLSPDLLHS